MADKLKQTIFFRADAGPVIGFGHLRRCLTLAEEISDRAQVGFICRREENTAKLVTEDGFPLIEIATDEELPQLEKILQDQRPDKLVVDHRDQVTGEYVERLQRWEVKVILLDNIGAGRFKADTVIYPGAHVDPKYFAGIKGKLWQGWDYALIRSEFFDRKVKHGVTSVLVTMGGSDPNNITAKVVSALEKVRGDFSATVIIGPGFAQKDWRSSDPCISFSPPRENLAKVMLGADLGALLFGTTIYEAAAARLPVVFVSAERPGWESQKSDAQRFAKFGTSVYLGDYQEVTEDEIKQSIQDLLLDRNRRELMSERARVLCKKKRLTADVILKC